MEGIFDLKKKKVGISGDRSIQFNGGHNGALTLCELKPGYTRRGSRKDTDSELAFILKPTAPSPPPPTNRDHSTKGRSP